MPRKIQLLTKEIEALAKKYGRQEGKYENAIVIAKFFHPCSTYRFFATELELSEEYPDETRFFGWGGHGDGMDEWGYVQLGEMEQCVVRGLPMERELHMPPMPLHEALKQVGLEYTGPKAEDDKPDVMIIEPGTHELTGNVD